MLSMNPSSGKAHWNSRMWSWFCRKSDHVDGCCRETPSLNAHAFIIVRTKYVLHIEEIYKAGAIRLSGGIWNGCQSAGRVLSKAWLPHVKLTDRG
jgi:hypothetical protein